MDNRFKITLMLWPQTLVAFLFCTSALAVEKSQSCPAGQYLVRAHNRRAYLRADGVSVSASYIRAHCKELSIDQEKWLQRFNDRPSAHWLARKERPKKWTDEEQQRILDGLSALPPLLLNASIHSLYRLRQSADYSKNPASGHLGELAIYDAAFSSSYNLSRILAYELAHSLYGQMSGAAKKDYATAANWLLVPSARSRSTFHLVPGRDHGQYVTEDGTESIEEDFSNNIEYFLFERPVLIKKTPRVYEWIKKKIR